MLRQPKSIKNKKFLIHISSIQFKKLDRQKIINNNQNKLKLKNNLALRNFQHLKLLDPQEVLML